MAITNKRSIMTLYSVASDPLSHRARIVLAEKGVSVEIINVKYDKLPEDLLELNPYAEVPTLVDRELVLFESQVIMEYLDERFPHPPLLPVYPVARAKARLMIHRIEKDWYSQMMDITNGSANDAKKARKNLRDSLIAVVPAFEEYTFFLNEEFSLVDCCMGPLLWRLKHLRVELPPRAKPLRRYAERLFSRDSFQGSLTDIEREYHSS